MYGGQESSTRCNWRKRMQIKKMHANNNNNNNNNLKKHMQIEKNTCKLRKHLHQFHNTCELQILTTPPKCRNALQKLNTNKETHYKSSQHKCVLRTTQTTTEMFPGEPNKWQTQLGRAGAYSLKYYFMYLFILQNILR